jgi:ribonuclease BN (tRNA processing enzyme)
MKETLTTNQVADRLREYRNGGFSYHGAYALAEYLENFEAETGEEMELDVIAISCDFDEYESYFEINEELDLINFEADFPDDEKDEKIKAELEKHTSVIEFKEGVIIHRY